MRDRSRREHAVRRPRRRCSRVADARAGPRDDFVRDLVCRVGPGWRARLGLHGPLQTERVPDRTPGGGPGAARLAGAAADGHADGSVRRTPRVHGAARLFRAGRLHRSVDRQLQFAARRGVPHRHARIVVRGRSRLRVALDSGGSAGHGARRLRPGDDGAVAGGLRRPGGGGQPGLGDGVPRHGRDPPGVGGGVCPAGAQSSAARPPSHGRSDGRDPARRTDRMAARRLLLPDLRRLRRVLGLPADAAAGAVRPGSRRCGTAGGRIRRARDTHAAPGRMAGGPDRRCPGPVVGVRRCRPVLAAPDVAVDGALHRRRARVRDADGTGQRRRLQAGAGALPERYRYGDRPGRRPRRTRGVLSAIAPRRLQRSPRRHLARLPPAVGDRAGAPCGEPARLPSRRRRVDAVLAGGRASGARACPGRRVGRAGHRHAGSGHRRRVAQAGALRRGAHRLHVRDAVCGVRDQLSLRDVAAASADTHVLASRVAGVLLTARARWQHPEPGTPGAGGVRGQRVHLQARPAPRTRALADHVGLPARSGDHVPAGLGMDPLRDRPRRPAHVPHVRVRYPGAGLPRRIGASPSSSSTDSSGRRSSSSPASCSPSAGA